MDFFARYKDELTAFEIAPAVLHQPCADVNGHYTSAQITKRPACYGIVFNQAFGEAFGFENADILLEICRGEESLGIDPYAHNYGGHQFGQWAGQLGDGRAIELGELLDQEHRAYAFQLKGAGRTPFSRQGDGRAVLRSSIREYVCAEAMHHLGVPTSRSLALFGTGDHVVRDMFYDGRPEKELGAIVCRVAPSFIRFGHFEIHARRGRMDLLKNLLGFCFRHHSKHLFEDTQPVDEQAIGIWFRDVAEKTAVLIADWMRFGFVHGVMNTDNMSIHGLTIDYGPYGWLSDMNPDFTPNTTDRQHRRYRYAAQPAIGLWNLTRLAEALSPLVENMQLLKDGLAFYQNHFNALTIKHMADKLGLSHISPQHEMLFSIADGVMSLMARSKADFTCFFRGLSSLEIERPTAELFPGFVHHIRETAYEQPSQALLSEWYDWFCNYHGLMMQAQPDIPNWYMQLNAINPKYIFRNAWAHEVIKQSESGDDEELHELINVLKKPYDEQPEWLYYAQKSPKWSFEMPGVASLSCSS